MGRVVGVGPGEDPLDGQRRPAGAVLGQQAGQRRPPRQAVLAQLQCLVDDASRSRS